MVPYLPKSFTILPSYLPSIKGFPSQVFLPSFLLELREAGTLFLSFLSSHTYCQISNSNTQLLRRFNYIACIVGPRFSSELLRIEYIQTLSTSFKESNRKPSGATNDVQFCTSVSSLRARSLYPTSPVANTRALAGGRRSKSLTAASNLQRFENLNVPSSTSSFTR